MIATMLEPVDAREAAAMLSDARREGRRLLPRGAGTKLTWSGPRSAEDVGLSLRRVATPIEHYAGDLVATIPAGATLSEANACLSSAGQWVPLDPPHAVDSTIGGIVATNASGPRRHRYGAPRDLIIGIEIALTDGRLAKAGGRVVKNVAGYDLSRLMCGSCGSLAVITSATFKLAPLAAVSRTLIARGDSSAALLDLARRIAAAPLTTSAIEIQMPARKLLVRIESTERAADRMAADARALIATAGIASDVVTGAAEAQEWDEHEALIWRHASASILKISVLPTHLDAVVAMLEGQQRTRWAFTGRAGLGVALLRLDGSAAERQDAFRIVHAAVTTRGGHVSVLDGHADHAQIIAADRRSRSSVDVSAAVKRQFDPTGVLPAVP